MDLKRFVKKKIEHAVSGCIAHAEKTNRSISLLSRSNGISVT